MVGMIALSRTQDPFQVLLSLAVESQMESIPGLIRSKAASFRLNVKTSTRSCKSERSGSQTLHDEWIAAAAHPACSPVHNSLYFVGIVTQSQGCCRGWKGPQETIESNTPQITSVMLLRSPGNVDLG